MPVYVITLPPPCLTHDDILWPNTSSPTSLNGGSALNQSTRKSVISCSVAFPRHLARDMHLGTDAIDTLPDTDYPISCIGKRCFSEDTSRNGSIFFGELFIRIYDLWCSPALLGNSLSDECLATSDILASSWCDVAIMDDDVNDFVWLTSANHSWDCASLFPGAHGW